MPIDVEALEPAPAGFDACTSCAYRVTGTPAICFACAIADSPAPDRPTCVVCGQVVDDRGSCPNTVCGFGDRHFSRLYTVSDAAEEMWSAVYRFKYGEERDLAEVLGRILVGFLEDNREELAGYDLITTGAIYVGPRAHRLWDYLQVIVEAAQRDGPGWPFAPGLIAKSGPTGRFLGISAAERRRIAEGELRAGGCWSSTTSTRRVSRSGRWLGCCWTPARPRWPVWCSPVARAAEAAGDGVLSVASRAPVAAVHRAVGHAVPVEPPGSRGRSGWRRSCTWCATARPWRTSSR
jgi:predicted amidophosphoribosyltransferase